MVDLESCLVGTWIHSHEEDSPEAQVYRALGYAFPPARGRRGFEFREGGEAILIGIAPTDGSRQATARWTLNQREVRIEAEQGPKATMTFQVVSCDEEMLRLKR